jgi:hypothetical protein
MAIRLVATYDVNITLEELNQQDTWAVVWEAMKSAIRASGGRCPIPAAALFTSIDDVASQFFRRQ